MVRRRRVRQRMDFGGFEPPSFDGSPTHAFMNLTGGFLRCFTEGETRKQQRTKMNIRKAILAAASAFSLASPAVASDLPVGPYTSGPTYERETHTYEHRIAPRVIVEEPAPVAAETVIVRRPVVVAPPRVKGCMRVRLAELLAGP